MEKPPKRALPLVLFEISDNVNDSVFGVGTLSSILKPSLPDSLGESVLLVHSWITDNEQLTIRYKTSIPFYPLRDDQTFLLLVLVCTRELRTIGMTKSIVTQQRGLMMKLDLVDPSCYLVSSKSCSSLFPWY